MVIDKLKVEDDDLCLILLQFVMTCAASNSCKLDFFMKFILCEYKL